jgi:hypothetical protein
LYAVVLGEEGCSVLFVERRVAGVWNKFAWNVLRCLLSWTVSCLVMRMSYFVPKIGVK